MIKTDIEGIYQVAPGILISTVENDYDTKLKKIIEEKEMKDKINNLEHSVSEMQQMLQQILQKVS